MDVLNFISWLKSKRQVTTVDASQTLIPLGLKDPRRSDGYLPGAISVEDLAGSLTPTFTNENTPYGTDALAITEQSFNVAIGAYSMDQSIHGGNNTAIGALTLRHANGSANTAVGFLALNNNSSGDANTAIGQEALSNSTTGQSNTAIGYQTLLNNTTGVYNTFVGITAGTGITTGSGNVGLGWSTLSGGPNGTGQNNIGIGQLAGENVGAANFSIAIGSGTQINGYSSSIVLGQNASATANNQLVIGSQSVGENIGTIATEALLSLIHI